MPVVPTRCRRPVVWAALVACWSCLGAADRPAVAEPPASGRGAVNPLAELATMGYQPRAKPQGAIRLAGSGTLQQAAAHWCQGFQRIHPGVRCSIDDCGSAAGLESLLDGRADVALLSRPLQDAEKTAPALGERRLVVVVVGFDRLVWIVHASNPIAALRWAPETGILRPEAAGDAAAAAGSVAETDWGRLTGDPSWTGVPIRVHGHALGSGTRWHLDRLLTGATVCHLEVHEHGTEPELVEAVAADRGSLGLVGDEHAHGPGIKRLPLVVSTDASPLADAVVGSDRTPDSRPLFLAVAAPAGRDLPVEIREFLEYVLSYQGQLDVAKDGLLPLSRGEIHAQKELLGWTVAR